MFHMAMDDGGLGVTFVPTGREQRQKQVGSPLQQAIEVLSLRLPQFAGARSPIPQELMGAPGGGGGMNSVIESILAQILGRGQNPNLGASVPGAAPNALGQAVQADRKST